MRGQSVDPRQCENGFSTHRIREFRKKPRRWRESDSGHAFVGAARRLQPPSPRSIRPPINSATSSDAYGRGPREIVLRARTHTHTNMCTLTRPGEQVLAPIGLTPPDATFFVHFSRRRRRRLLRSLFLGHASSEIRGWCKSLSQHFLTRIEVLIENFVYSFVVITI